MVKACSPGKAANWNRKQPFPLESPMTTMAPMTLESLLKDANSLPNLPGVVQQLIESFENDNVSIDEIADIISADPVLSAKLLRLANSAYYGMPRQIASVSDAMAMLGFITVRTLVVSSGLTGSFKRLPGIDLQSFWINSLHVACLAKHWSRPIGLNREQVFTVGIMHRIGELILHQRLPEEMPAVEDGAGLFDLHRFQVERRILGFSYAEAGAKLANHWHFPNAFTQSVLRTPEPLANPQFDPVAGLIYLATWRVWADSRGLTEEMIAADWPESVGNALNLTRETALQNLPPLKQLAAGLEDLIG
jgi:HD-like signal output (HDOD) protein